MTRKQIQREMIITGIVSLVGFLVLIALTSCSTGTTALSGCDHLLGLEKDRCVEEFNVRDAKIRRLDYLGPR